MKGKFIMKFLNCLKLKRHINFFSQSQISTLKSSQIEFESMKIEINRLLEEIILLQTSAEEANKLRNLAERQEEVMHF